jgi:hypothetical protein
LPALEEPQPGFWCQADHPIGGISGEIGTPTASDLKVNDER